MLDPTPKSPSEPDDTEELFLEWLERRERGDAGSFEALCTRHRDKSERLARLRVAHEQANDVFARLLRSSSPATDANPRIASVPEVSAPPRYELKGEIARGGMGTIFEVYDPSLRRVVAMKVLRRDRAHVAREVDSDLARRQSRLLSEAQILAQLDHPGVVAIHEMGLDEHGRAYFTMKRVRGQDFGAVIRAYHDGSEEWKLARVIGVLVKVCEAVAYAHQKGVIHRDLKPSNVLVGRFGEVFVMDWGLAKTLGRTEAPPLALVHSTLGPEPPPDARLADSKSTPAALSLSLVHTDRDIDSSSTESSPLATLAGEVVGTPAYMPPEQARGELGAVDARADVYAVGAVLYHIVAGKHPYADQHERGAGGVLSHVLRGPPRPLERVARRVPEELVAICDKAMSREPTERYQTILALADDLRAFLEGRVVHAHRTGAFVELTKWVRRNRWAAATVGVLIVGALSVAVVQSVLRRDIEAAQRETTARAESLRRQDYLHSVGLAAEALREGRAGRARALLDHCPEDLRAWEWRFLSPRVDTSSRTLRFEYSRNRAAGFARDGRSIFVSGSIDSGQGKITQFDADTGSVMCETDTGVRGFDLSADGRQLLVMAPDRQLRILDTTTLDALPGAIVEMTGLWPGVVCAPVGSLVAVIGSGPIELWDFVRRERVGILECGQDHCTGSWSPDATRFYSYSRDQGLCVWDVRDCALVGSWPECRGDLRSVVASPDGRWLATQDVGRRGLVLDAHTLQMVHRTDQLLYGPMFAWSPSPSRLAMADGPNIHLISTETWSDEALLTGHEEPLNSLAFDRKGERLLSCSFDGALKIWDLRELQQTIVPDPPATGEEVRVSSDGRRVAILWGPSKSDLEIWSMESRTLLRSVDVVPRTASVDLSFDGRFLLLPGGDRNLRLFQIEGDVPPIDIEALPEHRQPFQSSILRISPGGERLSVLGRDCNLSVWNRQSQSWDWIVRVADNAPDTWPRPVFGGEWSPDGRLLVTLPARGRVQLFDANSGVLVREWRSRMPCPQCALFSPDSRQLFLAGDWERGLECWDAATGELVWERGPDFATAIALGARGTRLFCVAANHLLDVRDAHTGEDIVTLDLDRLLTRGLVVSPVDDKLLTSSATGLRFWDTRPWPAAATTIEEGR